MCRATHCFLPLQLQDPTETETSHNLPAVNMSLVLFSELILALIAEMSGLDLSRFNTALRDFLVGFLAGW